MSRELIHLYGPISIQSFGLIITIGLLLFTWLAQRDIKRKKLMSSDQFSKTLFIGILSGIIGGRLLYIAQEYHSITSAWQIFSFWEGGFSILGTILAVFVSVTVYLKTINVPALKVFDIIALYAPLLQSISRLGCFVAGCCYGMPSTLPWATMYTNPNSIAPICIRLHPTQLYSSIFLFFIFLFMRFIALHFCKKIGQLITLYLTFAGTERFLVDFWRGDRVFFSNASLDFFSVHQWIALLIAASATFAFITITLSGKPRKT